MVEHRYRDGCSVKIGRNELCPCGSGLKHKLCCGATTGHSMRSSASPPPIKRPERPCAGCAACCQGWITTQVLNHAIHLDHPCPYSDGRGCTIHATRPQEPCRNFFCGWAEADSPLPEWMKPDLCGVITLRGRLRWRGRPVDILVSAGNDPDEKTMTWFKAQAIQNIRPFIYQCKEQWFGFGPQQFQTEIAAKAARNEPLWDGAMDRYDEPDKSATAP